MTLLRDLITIPEQVFKGDFVLKLVEGVTEPERTLKDYVVTPQLATAFEHALGLIKSALEGKLPPPRKYLVTYHGVLAPAAGLRPKVVPRQTAAGEEEAAGAAAGCRHGAGGGGESEAAGADNAATSATAAVCRQQAERRARARLRVPHRGGRRRSRRQRLPWADLLRRAFGIDMLVCPKCAGPRRVLAAIHDPAAIARLLAALGLTAAGADPSECRAPPAAEGDAADEGDAAE